MLEDLKNKVVLIMGASGDIGGVTAELFSSLGSKVVITGRNPEKLEKTATQCQSVSPSHSKPLTILCDLTVEEDAKNLINKIIETYGELDVVVNCASYDSYGDIMDENTLSEFDAQCAVKLRGTIQLLRLALPPLIKSRGAIVNMSSVQKPSISISDDKVHLIQRMIIKTCFCFSPGLVETESMKQKDDASALLGWYSETAPLRKVTSPKEIAETIAFLASNSAGSITGSNLLVEAGSSNGIGEAIVKLFAKLGSKVVVNGRDAGNVKRVVAECESVSPFDYKPLAVVGDLTQTEMAKNLVNKTIETFSRIDVLVNNAAIHKDIRILDKEVMHDFDDHHAINIRAAVELCHLTLPHLIESKGTIVNISAIPKPYFLHPCLTKASLDMLTKVLALEFGPKGVRVNAINVGPTDSETFKKQPNYEELKAMFTSRIPLGRVGRTEDIARGAVFLASDMASFITGALLPIDGGILLA
ncbi:hypothetical protein B4U79_10136 [Dinothrombium tinctorium]|uniref:Uncharacterized protein n=1 Tax=Dinothrombium tinctorium TaxID=1965070 RepID=A0A443RBE4_9ACAR|nr:hypothetical protein B4U79_10136 [Dinothrombium tinctorium]